MLPQKQQAPKAPAVFTLPPKDFSEMKFEAPEENKVSRTRVR